MTAVLKLADEPYPAPSKRLAGRGPFRRLRVGNYRVFYSVFEPDKLVTVDSVVRRTGTTYKER